MDVKDLRYFVAVYDSLSFSRAAARLDTVQSNVSARIHALETHLGATLFERLARAVAPTRPARRLYRPARRIIAAFDALERSFRRRRRRAPVRRAKQAHR